MSASLALPRTGGRAELRLAGHAALVLLALAVPVLAITAAFNGIAGAIGAAAGLALVGVLFGAAGAIQGLVARRSRSTLLAVVAGGFGVRLALYLAALQALGQVASLHRPSLAIATAIGFVVTLTYEMRLISTTPELFWVELDERSGRASAAHRASTKRS